MNPEEYGRYDPMDNVAKEIKALRPHIHSPVPNPAPLGLFAFGLTTALLQMKHTRLTGHQEADKSGVENLVWGFAIFYGGLLQVIAGLCEIRRNNIFGYTAFLSYGGFWMSLGTAEILVNLYADEDQTINPKATQAMLILMGIFTFVLWICTFKQNKTLCALIGMLMTTFFFLAIGIDNEVCDYIAGWCGIVTAAIAYWLGGAELVNDIIGSGNEVIPLGHFSGNQFRFAGHFHVPGRIHGATHTTMLQQSVFGPGNLNAPTLSERRQSDEVNKASVESVYGSEK